MKVKTTQNKPIGQCNISFNSTVCTYCTWGILYYNTSPPPPPLPERKKPSNNP